MIRFTRRKSYDFPILPVNLVIYTLGILNNIYAITQRNKDEEAGQAIIKMSGLMRYMICDSNVIEIDLARELEHIDNYLDVARLKFDRSDEVDIQLKKEGNFHKYKIAPLLLVPFVENAFKHGVGSRGDGYIHLSFLLSDGKLCFHIENPLLKKEESWKKHPGIGLDNVKKRLKMLYPDWHRLDISDSGG